jgi:peptidoglycan lytic transglycosylase
VRAWIGAIVVTGVVLAWAGPGRAADSPAPGTPAGQAEARRLDQLPPVRPPSGRNAVQDHSGRKQVGKASYYSQKFTGRRTASGKRFSPHEPVAASKTLPLGTTAKVTNQETGKSAMVSVEDRGPHARDRILDVSPKTANDIGISKKEGVAPVEIAPVAVPQKDGTVKAGAGAAGPH